MEQVSLKFEKPANVGKSYSVYSINDLLAALLLSVQRKPKVEPENAEKMRHFTPAHRAALDYWMMPGMRGHFLNDNTRVHCWANLVNGVNGLSTEAFDAGYGRQTAINVKWFTENIRNTLVEIIRAGNRGSLLVQMDEGMIRMPNEIKAGESVTAAYTVRSGSRRPGNRKARRQGKG